MADLINSTATVLGKDGDFTGIVVKIDTEKIDLYRLGRWVAEQGSDNQAEFIHGLADAIHPIQIIYMGEAIGASPAVDRFFSDIADMRKDS